MCAKNDIAANIHYVLTSLRVSKREVFRILAYFLAVVIFTVVIHELAHAVGAVIIGVPFQEIKIGLYGINPSIILPDRFTGAFLTPSYYAGGLAVGLILLGVYCIYWLRQYQKKPSLATWFMGIWTLTAAAFQLSQGWFEGRYHAAYISTAGAIFSPINVAVCVPIMFAFVIHFMLCPVPRLIQNGAENERQVESAEAGPVENGKKSL